MAPAREEYDVAALERALEHAEHADGEAHKVYNNLGLAHAAAGRHRAALRAHREEKRACKRLACEPGAPAGRLVDLAIAYRRCGDATLRVDSLALDAGRRLTARVDIARRAHEQHEKALRTAAAAAAAGTAGAAVEVQAASAAMAQSLLTVALDTKDGADFEAAAGLCGRAVALAERLTDEEAGGRRARASMGLAAAVNLAIAVSGLGDKARARVLFEAVAVRARALGDTLNLMRGIANLAEEAGDDGDWELCVEYVDEWIDLSREQRDEGEEGEALRKRGTALFEMHRYEEARVALDRAALLGREESAREEARRNLHLVECELEDLRDAEVALADAAAKCAAPLARGDAVAEACARLAAGEAAFKLRRDDAVFDHLSRYFVLVDDYGCAVTATGLDPARHCTAVANMAEALWRAKRFGDAVEWGMRELAVYKDDVAGQAQAWCNIGVYLDDDGKYEPAREALSKSIALADEAGDAHLREQAELNLQVVIKNQAEVGRGGAGRDGSESCRDLGSPVARMDGVERVAPPVPSAGGRRESRAPSLSPRRAPAAAAAEHSVVVDSGGLRADAMPRSVQATGATSGRAAVPPRHTAATGSRSAAGDRSSAGSRRYIDLVALYRRRCAAASHQGGRATVEPRPAVVGALRPLSAKLIACEDGDVVSVDLSASFLGDDELPPLVQTLAALPVREPLLSVDLRLNPLLGPSSVRWLASSSAHGPPRALPSVVSLDLSGTGIDASCLGMLARALSAGGTLPHVSSLAIGKNSLGEAPAAAADAVARLVVQESRLRSLDISLNLLPHTFLAALTDCAERLSKQRAPAGGAATSITTLDMRLNNRREPTALLECSPAGHASADAPAKCIRRLLAAVPTLQVVDVRACGAAGPVRRKLFELRDELRPSAESFVFGREDVDAKDVRVTSPDIFDPEEEAARQPAHSS